jgi:hypothetical protein
MPLRRSIAARNDPPRRASLERQHVLARTSYTAPAPQPAPQRTFLRATPAPRLPTPQRSAPPTPPVYTPSTMPRQPPVGTGAWVGPGPRGLAGTTVGPNVKPAGAPTGSVQTPGGAPSRVAPVSKLATTRDASGNLVERKTPLTRVHVERVSSDFTEDGGQQKGVLTDDPDTFWESEEDSDPPVPWIVLMLSQLDVVSGVYVRFDPRDEAEDLLPVEVEMITGASVKSGRTVSRVTIDPKSAELQPLMGPGITSGEWSGAPDAEDHEKFAISTQLLKEVFIVKLVFHGLREEQEGHIRVRQVLVRSKGMTREEAPRPSSASVSESAAADAGAAADGGGGGDTWPSGRQAPSASHNAALTPWKDKAAFLQFQREHSVPSIAALVRSKAERQPPGLNSTVIPAEHWTTHGPKYRIKVAPRAIQEPIRSELDSLYSHPNTSEDSISQGQIIMSQTAPAYTAEVWAAQQALDFDGRWDDDLSRRSRRRRAVSRGSSRGGSRSRSGGGSRRRVVEMDGKAAAWTEGDAMEEEWWGRVALLAPKGDRRVSAQLSDTYHMMHGSSPLGQSGQGGQGGSREVEVEGVPLTTMAMMGGMGDSYRSLMMATNHSAAASRSAIF